MPIVALAQAALARRRTDIAVDVFHVAEKPGFRREYPSGAAGSSPASTLPTTTTRTQG